MTHTEKMNEAVNKMIKGLETLKELVIDEDFETHSIFENVDDFKNYVDERVERMKEFKKVHLGAL